MNNQDKQKWDDLSQGLLRAAEEFKNDQYEDNRPLTMVETTFKILSCLLKDYEEGNREMTKDFATMLIDFVHEYQDYYAEKIETQERFNELLSGVYLGENVP